VIVVVPSDIPVKKVPQELKQAVQKLEQQIDHFEEEVVGPSTVPTVGALAGRSRQPENGTIVRTGSSSQYVVH
jgi:hypothetical protein